MEAPRSYRNEADLRAMYDLLIAGRHSQNGSYYVHTGDLSWWLFYPPLSGALWSGIHLWDDPNQPGRLLAWALLSGGNYFDVYVQPELRGSDFARHIFDWAIEQCTQQPREGGLEDISVMWIAEDDELLTGWLWDAGFRLKKQDALLVRPLDSAPAPASIPEGFTLRGSLGESEVTARARAQYGAFGNVTPFDGYVQRWMRFMRSPVYDPDLDVLAVTQDGQIAAFCIVWPDPVNRIGLFEPVGIHPDFQRKGLGKAIMNEASRRLSQRGMTSAMVCTPEDNLPALKLYESAGFHLANRLGLYQRKLD